jgi:hypothetical protein
MKKPRRLLSAPTSLIETHTLMIIQLDWFGCNPRIKWETQIHQTLEQFATLKPISRALVRVEQQSEQTPPYHLSMMLSIPGPDVLARSSGHTFDEALLKLRANVRKTLATRLLKSRRLTGAARGVKPAHRG